MEKQNNLSSVAEEYIRNVNPFRDSEDKSKKYKVDKLFKRLRRHVGQAIGDYGMIEEGDRILVCMSGGKDSYALLDLLLSLKRSAPVNFELIPVHIDSGFPNAPEYMLEDHLKKVGIEYHFVKKPVYELCKEKVEDGKPYCSMCSRLRRGFLYSFAREIGANKLALGHHKDDCIATLLLNMFYGGSLKAMPPILRNDKDDLTVIRPLIYCREKDIISFAKIKEYPILPKGLCGWGEDQQRANMNKLIRSWDKEYPKRVDIIFKAIKNVKPSQLLDKNLFDFTAISNGPKVK